MNPPPSYFHVALTGDMVMAPVCVHSLGHLKVLGCFNWYSQLRHSCLSPMPMLHLFMSPKMSLSCCLILTLIEWIHLWTFISWSLWLFKILGSIDWYSHCLHEYLSQCFMCMWVLRCPFRVVWYSHWLHEYICEPSCADLCDFSKFWVPLTDTNTVYMNIYPNALCVCES